MADPISIMAGLGSLILSCGQITMTINSIVSNMKNLDETLSGFSAEVDSLARILSSIKSLSDSKQRPISSLTGHEGELWTNMSFSVSDCGGTLSKLEQNLAKVYMPPNSRFSIPRKFVKMSMRTDEINGHRQQLLQFKSTLQLSLQAISLSNDVAARASADAVLPALDELTNQIRQLALRMNAAPQKGETERMGNCLRSAASVVSTASTIVADDRDRQTVVGSEFDDVFKPKQGEAMNRWLRTNTVRQPGGRAHPGAVGEGYDSDDDLNADVLEVYISKARNSLPGQPGVAENAARRALQQMPPEPHAQSASTAERYFETASLLGTALFVQDKLEEAELVLSELQFRQEAFHERTQPGDRIGSPAAMETQHRLAEVALKRRDPDKAEVIARKTLRSRTKLFGKDHPQRIETLHLLIEVCKAKGEPDEAEALLSLVPSHARHPSFSGGTSGYGGQTLNQQFVQQPPTGVYPAPVQQFHHTNPFQNQVQQTHYQTPVAPLPSPGLSGAYSQRPPGYLTTPPAGFPAPAPSPSPIQRKPVGSGASPVTPQSGSLSPGSSVLFPVASTTTLASTTTQETNYSTATTVRETAGMKALSNVEAILHRGDVSAAFAAFRSYLSKIMGPSQGVNWDELQKRFEERPPPSSQGLVGFRPLHLAAQADQPILARDLMDMKVDPEAEDADGDTALMVAVRQNNVDVCSVLLSKGANAACMNQTCMSPIHIAKDPALIDALLAHGAEIDAKNAGGNTALHLAVTNDEPLLVKVLLERGAAVELRDIEGHTPLSKAVSKQLLPVVQMLIDARANVNHQFGEKLMSPLHVAAEVDHVQLIKMLVDARANVNARNKDFQTPLYVAIVNNKAGATRHLLAAGADADSPDKSHFPPLIHAAKEGYQAIVQLLVESGADLEAVQDGGATALYFACDGARTHIVRYLLDNGANIEATEKYHWRALHRASRDGDRFEDVVRVLLDYGADINAQTNELCTPLYHAVCSKTPSMVRLLLDRKARVDIAQESKWTPLHKASYDGSTEIINMLLDAGANLQAVNDNLCQPIYLSCQKPEGEAMELLIRRGAPLNVVQMHGWAPIHYLSRHGHVSELQTLLKHNPDLKCRIKNGETALGIACRNGHLDCAKVLLAAGSSIDEEERTWNPIVSAANGGHTEIIKWLLEIGAKVDNPCPHLGTAAYMSVFSKNLDTLNALLAGGANLEARNNYQWTILTNSCKTGQLDFIRRVLVLGADVDSRESRGYSALHVIAEEWPGPSEEAEEAMRLLIQYRANPKAKNKEGKTPIDLAREKKKDNLVKILQGKA